MRPARTQQLLLAAALLAPVALAPLAPLAARAGPPPAAPPAAASPGGHLEAWPDDVAGRLVFFAVLEGLFLDGVQDAVVAAVLDERPEENAVDVATSDPRAAWHARLDRTLFVPGCQLCAPVHAAFSTYRARGSFGLKPPSGPGRTRDAFGGGLPEDVAGRLTHADRAVRVAALQTVVARWVDEALDRRCVPAHERAALALWMRDARERGMEQLRAMQRDRPALLASWPACASCDGAAAGVLDWPGPAGR
jgi:hypothetical protein